MTKGGTGVPRGAWYRRGLPVQGTSTGSALPMQGFVGWRERDWARLDADELETLYGADSRSSGARAQGPSTAPGQRPGVQRYALPAVVVSALATGAFGYLHWLRPPAVVSPTGPVVVYGQPIVDGPNPAACTELELAVSGRWRCLTVALGGPGTRVLTPRPYEGSCAHLQVDSATHQWICLGDVPVPDAELPPPLGSY